MSSKIKFSVNSKDIRAKHNQIVDATSRLKQMGIEVRTEGLRSQCYKQGLPISKMLEVHQLLGLMNYWMRRATPMQLAFLKVGMVGRR
jgi:hypothetical protein